MLNFYNSFISTAAELEAELNTYMKRKRKDQTPIILMEDIVKVFEN